MYCTYCGAELNNPNQKVCEICGKLIPKKKRVEESNREPYPIGDASKDYSIRKRRKWRCC